jgi:hypothetical protein
MIKKKKMLDELVPEDEKNKADLLLSICLLFFVE